MRITAEDFRFVRDLARRTAALVIEPGKEYLVETRLAQLVKDKGCNSLSDLISLMRCETASSELHASAVDALTTNETFFFRDVQPFEALRTSVIPSLIEKRAATRQLTIWSAACSSGQEPYSLAMLLREYFPALSNWRLSILATDYSPRVLRQARAGSYSQFEVGRGLPATFLAKYFTKDGECWTVHEDVRRMIEFREMNLVQSWPKMPAFDVIFVRNVMIYFDVPTKQSILQKMRNCIAPDGRLFLGAAETTVNLDALWQPVQHEGTVAFQPAGRTA